MNAARALVLALMVSVSACTEPATDAAPPLSSPPGSSGAEQVPVVRVGSARLRARITASGSLAARQVSELAAEVPGPLLAIRVDVGSTVDKGEELFRIDPGPYEMALAEARAALALARAEADHFDQEERRIEALLETRSVSKQHYEQVRTQAAVARARVTQMQARAARAARDLERTVVRAPYAGSVVARLAHEGAMAGSSPVLVLQESDALVAIIDVPEATPIAVRVGDPVELLVEALDRPLATRVERVSDRIDPATRTYEVRCPVPDATHTVKAGAYVRAELAPMRAEERPVVGREALLSHDGQHLVLRVADDIITAAPVRIGIIDERRAEILDGLAPGDIVVSGEAVRRLAPGQRIEPVFSPRAPDTIADSAESAP